jgi:hypothetical protein
VAFEFAAGRRVARSDGVCGFIFYFPFEYNAKARRKQLCDRTEMVQNQYYLTEIAQNLYLLRRTGLAQVF